MNLRVLTLNIWNNDGDPQRIEVINNELCQLAPDMIAFQEVLQDSERNQLPALLQGLPYHTTHQAQLMHTTPPYYERVGGCAVATKWPHRVVELLDLRQSDALDHPWCTLAILVDVQGLGEILFIGTTLAWRLNAEAARERQVVALTDLDARHRTAIPTIIAGDFNATPDASCIRYLTGLQSLGGHSVHYHDAWAIAGEGPGYTWSVDNPNGKKVIAHSVRQPNHRRRIDYIFLGSWHNHPKATCQVKAANLAFNSPSNDVWPSDHFGVVVDLEISVDE